MNNNFEHTAANFGGSRIHSGGRSLGVARSLIKGGPDMVFADLACGTGNLGNAMLGQMGQVIFTDSSPAMLEIAEGKNAGAGNAAFVLSDCHELPFDDGSIDVAGTRFAFHHFEDAVAIFKEMRRILKPGGLFLIIDLTGSADPAMDEMNHAVELLHDETHIKSYTQQELAALAGDAGFTCAHAEIFSESEGGIAINEWCRLTDREINIAQICDHLRSLTPQQLAGLGYSKNENEFINHVQVAVTIFKKTDNACN